MKANPIHYYCLVDKSDRSWKRRIDSFMAEMERTHSCIFTVEGFDASKIEWTDRRGRKFFSDAYVFTQTERIWREHGTNVDGVKFFVGEDNYEQGQYRLKGFKLGRIFNTYHVGVTRQRYAKDTGEHEVLHFVDEFIKENTGVSLEVVLGVQDFDTDIVHSQRYWKDENYKYDEVWDKISDHLADAVYQRRNKTLTFKIAQLKLIIKLLTQLIGLQAYKGHTIYEVDIKIQHTKKRHNAPLIAENAIVGHIDLGTEVGTVNEIINGTASGSYHWYIPRHAKYVVEFVPKDKAAWHAGRLSNPLPGLEKIFGGPNEQIESGEPNWYAYGICYEGLTVTTEPTEGQIDLAVQLMRMKKIHELPVYAHYEITDYKPLVVESFVSGIKNLLSK